MQLSVFVIDIIACLVAVCFAVPGLWIGENYVGIMTKVCSFSKDLP